MKSMTGFLENLIILFAMFFYVGINKSLKLSLALAGVCIVAAAAVTAAATATVVDTDNKQQSTKSGSRRNSVG